MTTRSESGGVNDDAPFRKPRIAGGLLLLGLVVALFLMDGFLPEFSVDSIQLGLVLGSGLLLLGVEAGRVLLRGGK